MKPITILGETEIPQDLEKVQEDLEEIEDDHSADKQEIDHSQDMNDPVQEISRVPG